MAYTVYRLEEPLELRVEILMGRFKADWIKYYVPVYFIDVEDVEDAFDIANGMGDMDYLTNFTSSTPSASIGDIFRLQDSHIAYYCLPEGWAEFSFPWV